MSYYNNECIICFTDISSDDYLLLECCKQTVHKTCLSKWYQTNIKNNNIDNKCFHCKNNNQYITNINNKLIIQNNNIIETNNDEIIEIRIIEDINNYNITNTNPNTNTNNNNNNNSTINNTTNNKYKYCKKIISEIMCCCFCCCIIPVLYSVFI